MIFAPLPGRWSITRRKRCATSMATLVQSIPEELKRDELRPREAAQPFPTMQITGGVRRTGAAPAAAVAKLLPVTNDLRRASPPISKLLLAENCGGSDGNSGITANPALGVASDELVRYGGKSALAGTPGIYRAGQFATRPSRRCCGGGKYA